MESQRNRLPIVRLLMESTSLRKGVLDYMRHVYANCEKSVLDYMKGTGGLSVVRGLWFCRPCGKQGIGSQRYQR
jgi:hypothetical protein